MAQPEKLNIWDRFFNRYRKEIVEENSEKWFQYNKALVGLADSETLKLKFSRDFIKYKIIDRLTGSETIEKVYLN
jgi:hypothetical protein